MSHDMKHSQRGKAACRSEARARGRASMHAAQIENHAWPSQQDAVQRIQKGSVLGRAKAGTALCLCRVSAVSH